MKHSDVEATIACLPQGRTLFRYYPDRYAVFLLSKAIGDGAQIAAVRKSRFGKLLDRPLLREVVAGAGDGVLRPDMLEATWPIDPQTYRLTLGAWGAKSRSAWRRGFHQTSRPGANLVLQLNFSAEHNEPYRRLIRPGARRPFEYAGHPNAGGPFHTLAWARIDIEYDTGEALIEEIQSDWIKLAAYVDEIIGGGPTGAAADPGFAYDGVAIDAAAFRTYADDVLNTHVRTWQDAMLTAALWFLTEEIGLRRVYYHDFDCGRRLKDIAGTPPPKSLYTRLPMRFCFEATNEAPALLLSGSNRTLDTLRQAGQVRFWRQEF